MIKGQVVNPSKESVTQTPNEHCNSSIRKETRLSTQTSQISISRLISHWHSTSESAGVAPNRALAIVSCYLLSISALKGINPCNTEEADRITVELQGSPASLISADLSLSVSLTLSFCLPRCLSFLCIHYYFNRGSRLIGFCGHVIMNVFWKEG